MPQRKERALHGPASAAARGFQMLLLTIAVFAGTYARTAVSPLQEAMRIALGLSDNQMALLQGPALALPMLVAAVPLGLLIDRYSRVRLLFMLAVVEMTGSVLTAAASNFALLFTARCVVGLAAFAINPVGLSLLADLYAPAQRGRATMAMAMGQFAGMSAAFALGGALLARSGSAPERWQWTMLCLAGPLALVALLMLVMREPPRTGLVLETPTARAAWTELWRYRAIIAPLLGGLVMAEMAIGAILVWTAPTLSRSFELAPSRVGAIIATGLLVSGVSGPIGGGALADLCHRGGGPRLTISVLSAVALLTVPASLFAVTADTTLAGVLFVVFMTVLSAIVVTATTLLTIVIPNELHGLCMALLAGIAVLFSIALAPVTVSLLSSRMGGLDMIGKALALVCVTTSALGGVAFALGRRHFSHPAVQ